MKRLTGRVAVVTGAASGIGLAVCEEFLARGMRVAMADVNADALRAQADRLRSEGGEILAVLTDVRDPDAVDRLGREAVARFGALHVAVNNAGIVITGTSWELALEDWQRVIDVNLWGVIHGIRAFVPLILDTGEEGHVVNVASMAAVVAHARLGPYTVAKHGLLGLTDVVGAELEAIGAPVGVSVVMPGMIRTGLNPIGTVEPATVAANVVDAIRHRRRYVFTDDQHGGPGGPVDQRLRAIVAAESEVLA